MKIETKHIAVVVVVGLILAGFIGLLWASFGIGHVLEVGPGHPSHWYDTVYTLTCVIACLGYFAAGAALSAVAIVNTFEIV